VSDSFIEVRSSALAARIDPRRGAEIASVEYRPARLPLLARTPWADHADLIRPARLTHPASASADSWMEAYSGGWQVLFPHAGTPEEVQGVVRHYHGEASSIEWSIASASASTATLTAALATVPARITRAIEVRGNTLDVIDVIENLADTDLEYDYVHHPAFGEDFLGSGGTIATSATRFVSDPDAPLPEFDQGSHHSWPDARSRAGGEVDLSRAPTGEDRPLRFGYLADFGAERWVSFTSSRHRVTATLRWSDPEMNHAWFWQQVRSHPGYPWFGRGYVVAVEPATTATSGPERARRRLGARSTREFRMSLTLEEHR
jgi:hypothetical protein